MVKCKSGLHEWINEEDALKCCAGYRRIMILYPTPQDVDRFCGWYGYKWVKNEH